MAKKRKATPNKQAPRPNSQSLKPKKKKKTAPPQNPHLVRKSLFLVLALVFALAATMLNLVVVPMFGVLTDKIMAKAKMNLDPEVRAVTIQQARDTANQVETEGAVLLKNNGTLPLAGLTRVNVFGWASTDWLGGGSGSGGIASVDVDLLGALEAAGIEYNAELSEKYESFQVARTYKSTLNSWPEQSALLYEPSIDDASFYTPELLANAQEFSDTALVVIGRINGESNDATKDQYKIVAAGGEVVVDESRSQLDLSTEEEALLAYVGATYENVVVLVNTGNTMTLGAIETTPGIDACLLVGLTGQF
ncbi:MAG: glycoside hydrolase family 3 C-terminal domain-containing protein, partial [Coriobacteriales bacterium]|nr:glycoside hydrolase family 3 C-terminal domain-containing protein [Coriobacteriales bacterium]